MIGVYLTCTQTSKEVTEAAKEVRMVEMKLENYSVEDVDTRSYKALVYSKNLNIFL